MISRIRGKLVRLGESGVSVELNGIQYEILVPATIMRTIERTRKADDPLELVTYYYHQVSPSREIPTLVGFLNEIEKEFFESFITVSGIGPKAAVKALALPFSTIAQAIDKGNLGILRSLPGIGNRRAREIVAKLQGKVGKYALIRDGEKKEKAGPPEADILKETQEVLKQLGYSPKESESMVQQAFLRNPRLASTEEVLNEVYRARAKDK